MHWLGHRFEPVDVDLVEVRHVLVPAQDGVVDVRTRVLFRCACGEVKVETLDGRWSLAQVKGGSS